MVHLLACPQLQAQVKTLFLDVKSTVKTVKRNGFMMLHIQFKPLRIEDDQDKVNSIS
jgi:hypothetical protein